MSKVLVDREVVEQPGVGPVQESRYKTARNSWTGKASYKCVQCGRTDFRSEHAAAFHECAAPQPAQQNDVEKEALLRALHAIDTAVVALPTFQVNTDGGIDAVVANIVAAIKSAADLLENFGAALQPAQQAEPAKPASESDMKVYRAIAARYFKDTQPQPAQQPEADKVLRQALEALEEKHGWNVANRINAIVAIRKHLGEA